MRYRITTVDDYVEARLLSTINFSRFYSESKILTKATDFLLSITDMSYKHELRYLLSNVGRMLKQDCRYVATPRKKYFYNTVEKATYLRMMGLLDSLESLGYINLYIGGLVDYDFFSNEHKFLKSLVEPTDFLINLFNPETLQYWVGEDMYSSVTQIRDRATGKYLEVPDTKEAHLIDSNTRKFNKLLSKAKITYKGEKIGIQTYMRVFAEDFTKGGRWFNSVGGVQTLRSCNRKYLQIDKEDCVDLDYSAMHISILYEQLGSTGKEVGELVGKNLYDLVDKTCVSLNIDLIEDHQDTTNQIDFDPVKNIVKFSVNTLLNSKEKAEDLRKGLYPTACKAITKEFNQDVRKASTEGSDDCKYVGIMKPFDAKKVVNAIIAAHPLLVPYFGQDCGVKLMNTESIIMWYILDAFIAKGETVLPYHDGILVKESLAGYAEGVMKSAWVQWFGTDRFCKIKQTYLKDSL